MCTSFFFVFHLGDKSKEEITEEKIHQLWNSEWEKNACLCEREAFELCLYL